MKIEYNSIMPWGRSFEEYISMFNLSPEDLKKSILGCSDGPASFNAVMQSMGNRVVSVDPIYRFSKAQINDRINAVYEDILSQTRTNADKFLWNKISSVEELGRIRMQAMNTFLNDYEAGLSDRRYLPGELPELPFENNRFDLIISSHFLLFYSENLSLKFHLDSIQELTRIAPEVRIFPIVDLNAEQSPHLKPLIRYLNEKGFQTSLEIVRYEFQKGGNQMLKISRKPHDKRRN